MENGLDQKGRVLLHAKSLLDLKRGDKFRAPELRRYDTRAVVLFGAELFSGALMQSSHTSDSRRSRVQWNATLSSRQRVLLHTHPILAMRQSWITRDDDGCHYDPMCLSLKVFEIVIDQSGFGNEVVQATLTDELCPLLRAMDEGSGDNSGSDTSPPCNRSAPSLD